MRLVVDTNILISALLAGTSLPAHLIVLWREGRFDLLTSAEQLDELMRVATSAIGAATYLSSGIFAPGRAGPDNDPCRGV